MRILLVEDEPSAARMMAKGLREQAYAVDVASDGDGALYQIGVNDYDLIVLDIMLPGKDGLEVCRELLDTVDDRVHGLDTGADDYLTKPFDFRELLAHIRALLRRGQHLQPDVIKVEDLEMDTRARQVRRGGRGVYLTAKEYALLEYLARRAGEVVARSDIAEHVWDENFDPFSNLIEVYVQRLRRKVDDGHATKLLHTRRGAGYVLSPGGEFDV